MEIKKWDKLYLLLTVCSFISIGSGILCRVLNDYSIHFIDNSDQASLLVSSCRVLASLGILLIPIVVLDLFIGKAKYPTVAKASVPVYLFSLIIALIAGYVDVGNGTFLSLFGFYFHVPAFLYLVVFIIAYLTSRYSTYGWKYFAVMLTTTVVLPAMFYSSDVRIAVAEGSVLVVTFLILTAKLTKEKRLNKKYVIITAFVTAAIVGGCLITVLLSDHTNYLRLKLLAAFTRKTNEYGLGWFFSQFDISIKNTKLFGASTYEVEGCPSKYFFTKNGSTCLEAILFWLGWIPYLTVLLSTFVLVFCLFKISGKTNNNYAKHFIFSTAVILAVRGAFAIISMFFTQTHGLFFPFMGSDAAIAVDILLLSASIILSKKRAKESLDKLDEFLLSDGMFFNKMNVVLEKIKSLAYVDGFEDEFFETEIEEMPDLNDSPINLREEIIKLQKENERLKLILREGDTTQIEKAVLDKSKKKQVFISYNHMDLEFAELLCTELEAKGLTVWYYDRNIDYGDYAEKIVSALRGSCVFAVLLTQHSNESPHVLNEVSIAFEMIKKGMVIMPILIDDIALSDNLYYFLCRQEISVAYKPPIEEQISRVARKIYNLLKD